MTRLRISKKTLSLPIPSDGFWVQRQKYVPDPVTAADEAASVLSILSSESSLCDCENQLEKLLDYQIHHIIHVFIKNHGAVCTCVVMQTNGLTLRLPCAKKELDRFCASSLAVKRPRQSQIRWTSIIQLK